MTVVFAAVVIIVVVVVVVAAVVITFAIDVLTGCREAERVQEGWVR